MSASFPGGRLEVQGFIIDSIDDCGFCGPRRRMALSMDVTLCQLAPIIFRMGRKIHGRILSGGHC
jgi:hypothetical protein